MNTYRRPLTLACLSIIALALPSCSTREIKRGDISLMESQVFELVNESRTSAGLSRLRWSESISIVCRSHARMMAEGSTYLGHRFADYRAMVLDGLIGIKVCHENVGMVEGFASPVIEVVRGWLASPRHATNVFSESNISGVGAARGKNGSIYFVQIFALDLTPDR